MDVVHDVGVEEEARLLGAEAIADEVRNQLSLSGEDVGTIGAFELCFIGFWAKSKNLPLTEVLRERRLNASTWATRFDTYRVPLLFTLRRGKPNAIRKYYAGWNTFVLLSGSNIRYLLELVERSLLLHLENSVDDAVSAETQTQAAQAVAKKNLSELEGLTVEGARLVKLVLSLGRVFGLLAEEPEGHTPEVTQFALDDTTPEVEQLLRAAVMHLALVRFPGSKLQSTGETKDHDHALHPIFAPFFWFSHRRKRKWMHQILL